MYRNPDKRAAPLQEGNDSGAYFTMYSNQCKEAACGAAKEAKANSGPNFSTLACRLFDTQGSDPPKGHLR